MNKKNYFVLFYIKKTKLLKNGDASVCMRITYNRQRAENLIRKSVPPALWDQKKECSRGRTPSAIQLNNYIEHLRLKLFEIYRNLTEYGEPISANLLRDHLFGHIPEKQAKTLLTVFREHNEQCEALIGKDYVEITVRRYKSCCRYLEELILEKYGKSDLLLKEIDGEFVRAFEFFLKTKKGQQQNTVIRYMKSFKKIINLALANEWIHKNPFVGIRFREKEVHRDFLDKEELQAIEAKKLEIYRMDLVRDIFLFCCYTGIAFIDVQQLSKEHIVKDNAGNLWIRKARQKTNNMCNVPLLDIPLKLIQKYADHPNAERKGTLFPVPCNQRMNVCLKELAAICKIYKNLTTHVARHTYATTVCLANGVSMENLAKMLGHSDTKMTKRYARILDSSILKDMELVKLAL